MVWFVLLIAEVMQKKSCSNVYKLLVIRINVCYEEDEEKKVCLP